MRFQTENGVLIAQANGETLRIEPWGKDSLRVRATMLPGFSGKDWALTEVPEKTEAKAEQFAVDHLEIDGSMGKRTSASITNGKIRAVVNFAGVITFYKEEQEILREYHRCYDGTISKESRCLKTVNREWKGVIGGSEYGLNLKFESNDEEKIFGMGQYQQKYMDLKGCTLELAQRNSQISVPFAVSSLGYGMLWNNPAVGQVTFGKNYTEWTARSTKDMDYWLTAADTPKEILENYTAVTGRAPKFPEDRMGLWQCKLRYRTQEEVLEVARRYQKEGIKIDQIVIDFFHWTVQGDWKFDEKYWPNPKAMVDELHSMGIKVIVSVWPSVDRKSENFWPMLDRGLLIKTERGALQTYDFQGDCVEIDVFNPETRKYVWEVCKKNYYDFGIDAFWLDNSEPDFGVYVEQHECDLPEAKGYVLPYGDCPLRSEKLGERVYLDILNRATGYVHIMTPYLVLDGVMENALEFAAERGVDVKLILPGIPDKKAAYALAKTHYRRLIDSGVKIYEYTPGFVHAKVFVADDREAVVGSINLDYRSLYHHFECAAYMYDTNCIPHIEEDFQQTLDKCRRVTYETIRKEKLTTKLVGFVMKAIAPLI